MTTTTKGPHHERAGVRSVQDNGCESVSDRSMSGGHTRHQPAKVEFLSGSSSLGERGAENKIVDANRNRMAKDSGCTAPTSDASVPRVRTACVLTSSGRVYVGV